VQVSEFRSDHRWRLLALLFLVRTVMAFQFATIGALGPLVGQTFEVDAAGVGLLIGLYLSPGLLLAVPGGAVGRFLGDKKAVLVGLALMTAGGAVMVYGTSWNAQLAGRLTAGVGGILLTVLMAKMVTDLFAGRAIATAMALLMNSWPFGIAIALVMQPSIALSLGLSGAYAVTTVLSAAAFAALLIGYRQPPSVHAEGGGFPRGGALIAVLIAGTIWGLFNGAFAMLFGFGSVLLEGRGWALVAASSATSIAIWISVFSVPAGGVIADRTGRPNLIMVLGLVLFALSMLALPRFDATVTVLVIIGVVSGLPVGPILALPSRVLPPENRALGMGLFFTMFFAFVVLSPLMAGALLDWSAWDGVAMDLGAAMLMAAIILLAMFEKIAARVSV
jgi:MFS family permease